MPVTFSTKSHARVTQLDSVAKTLLRMMGHPGDIPGALQAPDVAPAAERLRSALAALEPDPERKPRADNDDDSGPPVSMAQRALPLLELLDSAAERNDYVMWG